MLVNLIERTVNISSIDLAYTLEFAETASKNLRVGLCNDLVGLDLDDEALDGIAEITREERSKLGNQTLQSPRMRAGLASR